MGVNRAARNNTARRGCVVLGRMSNRHGPPSLPPASGDEWRGRGDERYPRAQRAARDAISLRATVTAFAKLVARANPLPAIPNAVP